MPEQPALLSPDLARRVVRVVERVEGMPGGKGYQPRPLAAGAQDVWVRVTSTTVTSGRQPGKIQVYDYSASAGSRWNDGNDCLVEEVNGVTMATGRVRCSLAAIDPTTGEAIFLTRVETPPSGQSGTFKVCDSGGTVTKTLTFTDGDLTGVA